MLSPHEALQQMLAAVTPPPPIVRLPLADALGSTLAVDIVAACDVPPFDNSAMDGYALRAADALAGHALPVHQRVLAGETPRALPEGMAARIFTGAPVPAVADSVVAQEDCREIDGAVQMPEVVASGHHLRRRGEDIAAGSLVLPRGRRLRPQDLGLLASVGVSSVDVHRPLRVAVLVTGNELHDAGDGPLPEGSIFNSNGPMLTALLRRCGFQPLPAVRVADSEQAVAGALLDASQADVIVSTGGVSVGEADHMKSQVERLGSLSLWRIAIKPGKPLAFGRVGGAPFIGLPGNPSSVFVTFAILARPFLLACQGRQETDPLHVSARAGFTMAGAGTREEYLRVSLSQGECGVTAQLAGNQSSGALTAATRADGLAVVPPGTRVEAGDVLDVILIDALIP